MIKRLINKYWRSWTVFKRMMKYPCLKDLEAASYSLVTKLKRSNKFKRLNKIERTKSNIECKKQPIFTKLFSLNNTLRLKRKINLPFKMLSNMI
jgi:hypothetical protein